jgi:DNA-directed RNA polymerase specialized sigma24 family protein
VLQRDRRLAGIEALYRREFSAFVRVARGIVGDRERALEAVHDGFADAIRGEKVSAMKRLWTRGCGGRS